MRASVIRPHELGAAEIGRWHSFQHSRPEFENAFLAPEFAVHVGRVRPATMVAVIEDGPSTVAFFPFERGRLGSARPIAPGINDCQAIVHGPDTSIDLSELLVACGLEAWRFDHLLATQAPPAARGLELHRSWVADFALGYEAYLDDRRRAYGGRMATTLRRSRKLAREHPQLSFELASRDVEALRTLMRWKSAQYRRTGRPDRFARPWVVRLIESLLSAEEPLCGGVLSVMSDAGEPVAAHFGLRAGSTLTYWFPAYNVEYSGYSPGIALFLRMVEAGAKAGLCRCDLGKGDEAYKEVLANEIVEVAAGAIERRSALAYAHWLRHEPARRVMRYVLSRPELRRSARYVLGVLGAARTRLHPQQP